jgi:hypothetical protein
MGAEPSPSGNTSIGGDEIELLRATVDALGVAIMDALGDLCKAASRVKVGDGMGALEELRKARGILESAAGAWEEATLKTEPKLLLPSR